MTFKKIRLELARSHDFPEGSWERGYEFVAPLKSDGHIDADSWRTQRDRCRVRRFWPDQETEIGHLVHKRGGAWAFHYDIHGDESDDETGFKFDSHAFKPGEYVSIREHDDTLQTFRVVAVQPV